jgi:Arc/MetJ family transcription regulator
MRVIKAWNDGGARSDYKKCMRIAGFPRSLLASGGVRGDPGTAQPVTGHRAGRRPERPGLAIGVENSIIRCHFSCMRTTLALDDTLLLEAEALTGLREKSALVREALKALIERESARRLARLAGTEPDIAAAPRRRPG